MTALPRRVWCLLGALLLAAVLRPAGSLAGLCGPYFTGNIPDCEPQMQAPIS